jgi:hypothetical protein
VGDQKPHYSGEHRRHGMNVQVIADPAGRLVWASAASPGAAHDLTAARTHGIIGALTSASDGPRRQGVSRRRRHRPHAVQTTPVPAEAVSRQKAVNKSHARIRARGERAVATLKTWKVLAKLRCSPSRTTAIVQAILALHHVENHWTRQEILTVVSDSLGMKSASDKRGNPCAGG